MLSFAEDRATINIVQERIKLVGLIGEAAIVVEDVVRALPFLGLVSDTDGRGLCGRRWIGVNCCAICGDVLRLPARKNAKKRWKYAKMRVRFI